jgi:hypothetical protein
MSFAIPIEAVQTISGNQWKATRLIEEAAQTFLIGTPVSIASGDGGIQAWDGTTLNAAQGSITGVSYEAASNLSTTGKGAPAPFQGLSGPGSAITFGSVPNEPSAVNIPHGAPINDGRVGFISGVADNVFSAAFGDTAVATTPAATDVGLTYGLTKETSSGFWYVDKGKTSTSSAVQVMALDPRDTPAAGSRVLFTFLPGVVDLTAV